MSTQKKTHRLTVTAMLSAVACALMYLELPLPFLIPPFVKLDISDLPELLAAFSLGPLFGALVSLLKNLLYMLLHGTTSVGVGELCNFLFGVVFSVTAGSIYWLRKNRRSAFLGAILGALSMALASLPLNFYLIYPFYAKVYLPMDNIIAAYQAILPSVRSLWDCLLIFNFPFTFFKGLLDTLICILIYKPLSPILHR